MDGLAECASALAVDNPYLKNPLFPARLEVIRQELPHVLWIKGMKIQRAVDRQFDCVGILCAFAVIPVRHAFYYNANASPLLAHLFITATV